jgi:hypothetical protein
MTLSWQKRCRSAAGIQRVATRSRTNLSHCDQQARQMLFTLRSIVLVCSSIAASRCVCGPVSSVPRRRARGTGRDVSLRCRRSWCRAAAMQASKELPPAVGHAGTPYRAKIVRTSGRAVLCQATRTKGCGASCRVCMSAGIAPARGRHESGRCGKSGSGHEP